VDVRLAESARLEWEFGFVHFHVDLAQKLIHLFQHNVYLSPLLLFFRTSINRDQSLEQACLLSGINFTTFRIYLLLL
jgi:hypothetical protein